MRGTLSVTVAPGGVGKSALAVAEAVALASGRDFLGEHLPEGAARTWYINCEDPDNDANPELSRRVAATCRLFGVNEQDLNGRLFIDSAVGTPLKLAGLSPDGKTFIVYETEFARLQEQIRRSEIDVLVIDPFVSVHDLNENDNPMIDRLCKRMIQLASETGCAVHLIHHTRKTNGAELDAESARGASALIAAARVVRVLNSMTKDEAGNASLPDGAHRRFFRTLLDKQNLAPPEAERNWYQMESIDMDNGQPPLRINGDHVGVPRRWDWPSTRTAFPPHLIHEAQARLDGKDYPANVQARDWAGWVVARTLGMEMSRNDRKAPIGSRAVTQVIRQWIADGWLVQADIENTRTGRRQAVIRVAEWAEPGHPHPETQGVETCGSVDDCA